MMEIKITKLNKRAYKDSFVTWMEDKYPNIKRPNIMGTNIMYSINRDCGFSINDLINNRITLDTYRDKYEAYFETIHRKSPKGHANVHKWNAQYFIEFINDVYLNKHQV